MPFVNEILTYRSVSIAGLEKNTGKTESLNYVLNRLKTMNTCIALTSIGVDGEKTDQVTRSPKPEITVYEGMIFVTSEKHYLERKIISEILDVSQERTALGRLITARAKIQGKVILSGPSGTAEVRKLIENMEQYGVNTVIVDGALSRLSFASPAVTDALILATGASLSANIPQLVSKTNFVKQLIELPLVEDELAKRLQELKQGIWGIDETGRIHDLEISSVFLLDKTDKDIFRFGNRIFIPGAITDKLIAFLLTQNKKVELIVSDFSRIFCSQNHFSSFLKRGNTLKCILQSKLIAITVNPVSPNGFTLNRDRLLAEMQETLKVPVYDIKSEICS